MKRLTSAATILLSIFVTPTTPEDIEAPPELRWETSMTDALDRAAREGKGIFMLHLFGKFDEEMC